MKRAKLRFVDDHQLGVIEQMLEVIFAPLVDAEGVVMRQVLSPFDQAGRLVGEGLKQEDLFPSVAQFDQFVAIGSGQLRPPGLRVGEQLGRQALE